MNEVTDPNIGYIVVSIIGSAISVIGWLGRNIKQGKAEQLTKITSIQKAVEDIKLQATIAASIAQAKAHDDELFVTESKSLLKDIRETLNDHGERLARLEGRKK